MATCSCLIFKWNHLFFFNKLQKFNSLDLLWEACFSCHWHVSQKGKSSSDRRCYTKFWNPSVNNFGEQRLITILSCQNTDKESWVIHKKETLNSKTFLIFSVLILINLMLWSWISKVTVSHMWLLKFKLMKILKTYCDGRFPHCRYSESWGKRITSWGSAWVTRSRCAYP